MTDVTISLPSESHRLPPRVGGNGGRRSRARKGRADSGEVSSIQRDNTEKQKIRKERAKLRRKAKRIQKAANAVKQEIVSHPPRQAAPPHISDTSSLRRVMHSLAEPHSFPPVRYSDSYSAYPTATAVPRSIIEPDEWKASPAPGPSNFCLIPPYSVFFAMFRDPLRSHVFQDPNAGGQPYEYPIEWTSSFGSVADSSPPVSTGDIQGPAGLEIFLPIAGAAANSSYAPHGPYLFAGNDPKTGNGSEKFIWLDLNEIVHVTCTDCPSATTVNLNLWTPAGVTRRIQSTTLVNVFGADKKRKASTPLPTRDPDCNGDGDCKGPPNKFIRNRNGRARQYKPWFKRNTGPEVLTQEITIENAGYYSVSFMPDVPTNAVSISDFQIMKSGDGAVMSHRSTKDLKTFAAIATQPRVLASSVLFTNATAVIDLDGTLEANQFPMSTDWLEVALGNRSIGTTPTSYVSNAKKGMYAWLKPSSIDDFKPRIEIDVTNADAYATSFFNLRNDSSWLCFMATFSSANAANFAGRLIVDTALEYQTNNSNIGVSKPMCSKPLYEAALKALGDVVQFTENPSHVRELLRSILNKARSVIGTGIKYAPTAMKLIDTFGEFL
jgi:hypothetical protein